MDDGLTETKVWGSVRHLFDGPVSVSILQVDAGTYCSLHRHASRWNMFFVVCGSINVVVYDSEAKNVSFKMRLRKGQTFKVNPGVWHRFEVIEDGRVVETYWTDDGSPATPGDIERLKEGGRF